MRAWQCADVAGLVALLKEDATFAMPPSPSWFSGRSDIGTLAAATVFGNYGMFSGLASGRWRLRAVGANGQPAFVLYQRTARGTHEAFGLTVLTLTAGQIAAGVCFLDPALAAAFGQPTVI